MYLVHAQFSGHVVGHPADIAGEHDGLFHARLLQGGNGLLGVGLHHIGNDDVAGVLTVDGQMDDGADAMAVVPRNAQSVHELAVAHGYVGAVHLGGDAIAADLLHVRDTVAVDLAAVGPLEALADGMGGGALRQSGVLQNLLLGHGVVVNAGDVKDALGQGAGLVKDHHTGFGEGLQIVGSLHQHTGPAGTAQSGEEAQGDADDQRTGAADDQEGQGTVDPSAPVAAEAHDQPNHRRQHRQHQSADADGGGIDAGEFGDEVLRAGFVGAGVLHQLQNFGDGGLAEGLGGADLQHARHIDAAADDLVAGGGVTGQALAGEGGGVQGRAALRHYAVQRDLLAGLHHDDAAHGHVVRVHLHQLAVLLDVGIIRANIHQGGDAAAALAHGVALEQLTDLIEQHHGHGLQIVAASLIDGQRNGAHGGHRHQEVLVEHLTLDDAPEGLAENIIADDEISSQIQHRPGHAADGEELHHGHQHRRGNDAPEDLLLLLCHVGHFLP